MNSVKIKNLISLFLNILTAFLVAVGISWFFYDEGLASGVGNMGAGGLRCLVFFTNESNIFVALCCLLTVPFNIMALKSGKDSAVPKWVLILKFVGTTAVTVTFMVVMLFLGPIVGYASMFEDGCLYLHLICPIIAIISFCFFEKGVFLSKKQALLGVLPTLIYGTVYLINVIFTKEWDDFYHFNIGGYWYISYVVMLVVTYIFALVLRALHNRAEK